MYLFCALLYFGAIFCLGADMNQTKHNALSHNENRATSPLQADMKALFFK